MLLLEKLAIDLHRTGVSRAKILKKTRLKRDRLEELLKSDNIQTNSEEEHENSSKDSTLIQNNPHREMIDHLLESDVTKPIASSGLKEDDFDIPAFFPEYDECSLPQNSNLVQSEDSGAHDDEHEKGEEKENHFQSTASFTQSDHIENGLKGKSCSSITDLSRYCADWSDNSCWLDNYYHFFLFQYMKYPQKFNLERMKEGGILKYLFSSFQRALSPKGKWSVQRVKQDFHKILSKSLNRKIGMFGHTDWLQTAISLEIPEVARSISFDSNRFCSKCGMAFNGIIYLRQKQVKQPYVRISPDDILPSIKSSCSNCSSDIWNTLPIFLMVDLSTVCHQTVELPRFLTIKESNYKLEFVQVSKAPKGNHFFCYMEAQGFSIKFDGFPSKRIERLQSFPQSFTYPSLGIWTITGSLICTWSSVCQKIISLFVRRIVHQPLLLNFIHQISQSLRLKIISPLTSSRVRKVCWDKIKITLTDIDNELTQSSIDDPHDNLSSDTDEDSFPGTDFY
jgi:hypothetical protein